MGIHPTRTQTERSNNRELLTANRTGKTHLTITPGPYNKYLQEPPTTMERCEGPLCRDQPVQTTGKAAELKWRPHPKNLVECAHCANHTSKIFNLVKLQTANKITKDLETTNQPLPHALQTFLAGKDASATLDEVAGKD